MSNKKRNQHRKSKNCRKKQVEFFLRKWFTNKMKEAANELIEDIIKGTIKFVICFIIMLLYDLLT